MIKKFLKKFKPLVFIVRNIRRVSLYIRCKIQFFLFSYDRKRVVSGKKKQDERLNYIKELKDKYKGKRCFILGNGPSLKIEDLKKLNGEITFGTNGIITPIDGEQFVPTYYIVGDIGVFKMYRDEIKDLPKENVFLLGREHKGITPTALEMKNITEDYCFIPADCADIWYDIIYNLKNYVPGFSMDCSEMVRAGTTTIYSVLQIAIYMGFKKIYLLGMDCDYGGKTMHFYKEKDEEYDLISPAEVANMELDTTWRFAKDYTGKLGVKIYNSTRGGRLELFERIDFDSIFVTD